MGNVERKGDPATCGHVTTGSTNVFVNGRGAARVGKDVVGGVILGPGVPTVLVNGFPISLRGDVVAGHCQHEQSWHTVSFGYNKVLQG